MSCCIPIPEQSSVDKDSKKDTKKDDQTIRKDSKEDTAMNEEKSLIELSEQDTKKDEDQIKLSTKDDVYCYALVKTLEKASCPVTVGFYAPWGRGKEMLLEKVEQLLSHRPSESRNLYQAVKDFVNTFFIIPFFMIFYHPNQAEEQRDSWNNRYIFIRFSAWEYAGSDHIWAGLITNLCEHIEQQFGTFPISLYRALGENTEMKNEKSKPLWINKSVMCLPLWLLSLLVIMLGAFTIVLFVMFGFEFNDLLETLTAMVEGAGVITLIFTVRKPIVRACETLVNSVMTQKVRITRKMNCTDMSSQLGFMNDVKKEVNVIINYLHFMEVFLKVNFRVVLEITKLDMCMPDKAVGVLNALHVLLSDPNAPFISILAVDPSVIVQCVEKSTLLKGMANNGYLYLNRMVELPFCIPEMDKVTKSQFLPQFRKQNNRKSKMMNKTPKDKPNDMDEEKTKTDFKESPEFVGKALDYISNHMGKYIDDNIIHMKRMVNTIPICVRLMLNDRSREDYIEPEKVAKWVLLTTQWPCRMSWIMQVIEDEVQRMRGRKNTDNHEKEEMKNKTLWEIFVTFLEQLDNMKSDLKNLLELDGDPEIFHELLCNDVKFTFDDACRLKEITVNLDHSIKRQMELLLGSYNLMKFKRKEKLTPWCLLKMSTDDVCEKIKDIFLKEYMEEKTITELNEESKKEYNETREKEIEEYLKRIRNNNLNGRAIVCSNNEDLSKALQMKMDKELQDLQDTLPDYSRTLSHRAQQELRILEVRAL